jgi:predicted amidohydrolase YtcJ
MTPEEALYSYTLWNAYAAFEEHQKGSLKVGKVADIAVLDRNLLTCPTDEMPQTKALMTILAGKIVYQDPNGR